MIVLRCPYCHEQRTEEELTYGGEAGIERPPPDKATDEQWSDYLFMRTNRKGLHHEQWCCSTGCGQWFKLARHTVTHEVTEVTRFDEPFAHELLTVKPVTDPVAQERFTGDPGVDKPVMQELLTKRPRRASQSPVLRALNRA